MRYFNKTEIDPIYDCVKFPLNDLFSGETIDLYRALNLDFDLQPDPMPNKIEILLSIVTHTQEFAEVYAILSDLIRAYDFQGALDNGEEYLSKLEEDKKSLIRLILTMNFSHKNFVQSLPSLFAEKIKGL